MTAPHAFDQNTITTPQTQAVVSRWITFVIVWMGNRALETFARLLAEFFFLFLVAKFAFLFVFILARFQVLVLFIVVELVFQVVVLFDILEIFNALIEFF